jgi:hypothetical protein
MVAQCIQANTFTYFLGENGWLYAVREKIKWQVAGDEEIPTPLTSTKVIWGCNLSLGLWGQLVIDVIEDRDNPNVSIGEIVHLDHVEEWQSKSKAAESLDVTVQYLEGITEMAELSSDHRSRLHDEPLSGGLPLNVIKRLLETETLEPSTYVFPRNDGSK